MKFPVCKHTKTINLYNPKYCIRFTGKIESIEWNKKGWLHKNYIYIITIQMISIEATKVNLKAHNICQRQIYFHLTLLIRYFMRTDLVLGHKMADETAFYLSSSKSIIFCSPALLLPCLGPLNGTTCYLPDKKGFNTLASLASYILWLQPH